MPNGETFRAPGLPFEVDRTPIDPELNLPDIGQHTTEILSNLGLSAEEIAAAQGQQQGSAS
jgi:crotonobetainyl-CoA:carnitine CoA-transferase CaiB-like acyl-CoA transferase